MGLRPSYALRLGRVSGRGLVNASPRGAAAGSNISGRHEARFRQDPGCGFFELGCLGWDDVGEDAEAAHAGREAAAGGWEAAAGGGEGEKGLKEV